MRIAVAMSGGVDSSTAALLLREEGHDVFGITAWLWRCEAPENPRACCGSPEGIRRARDAALAIGLSHEVVDLSDEFEREVVGPTVRAYAEGRTPNPCVLCNAFVRFPFLIQAARAHGAEALATGHYARLGACDRGDSAPRLLRGRDGEHDQSYFLFAVAPEQLAFARFPLGGFTKSGTRKRASEASHPAADRISSQDLCFTGGRRPVALVRARAPEAARPGPIRDLEGNVLGRHTGLAGYTVGQRKGIGIAWREPLYVIELRPETNELVVGAEDALFCSRFEVEGLRAFAPLPSDSFETLVQIRYRAAAVPARVRVLGDGRAEVILETPVRAVAPGQCAVFYGGEEGAEVLGGGWIARGKE